MDVGVPHEKNARARVFCAMIWGMFDRTFPFHALPAFDAASRHGSFKAAAAVLHLTPSAVSHQIKQLEGALGVALFRRLPRGLELTAAGQRYAGVAGEVLERLAVESAAVAGRSPRLQVRFSMPAFVAEAMALPTLMNFRRKHPDIELSITTGMALADLEGGEVDAAIRFGPGRWHKLASTKLSDCYGVVVVAPDLAKEVEARNTAGTLPVVCLSSLRDHTREVLAAAGLHAGPNHMLWLDSYASVVQAARLALGVAVVYVPEPTPRELRGLKALAWLPNPLMFGMYFVCRTGDAKRPEVMAIRSWVLEDFMTTPWILC